MSDLPFVLRKYHKSRTKSSWKSIGIKFRDDGHFEFVYYEYIYATNCELCNKLFPNSKDRHIDHNHITGEPRNIVCTKCNSHKKDNKKKQSNTGEDYISKCKDKNYKTGQNILKKVRKSLEEAITCRDEFLVEHPEIFT